MQVARRGERMSEPRCESLTHYCCTPFGLWRVASCLHLSRYLVNLRATMSADSHDKTVTFLELETPSSPLRPPRTTDREAPLVPAEDATEDRE